VRPLLVIHGNMSSALVSALARAVFSCQQSDILISASYIY
jgi:hypothetical protein